MIIFNKISIRNLLYLVFPIFCLIFWALLSLIKDNFSLTHVPDFPTFYKAGKFIYTDSENLYSSKISPRYHYFPSFASIFFFLTFFDIETSKWIYFFILLSIAIFSVIEFNKILILKNVDNKFNRFLYLMVLKQRFS